MATTPTAEKIGPDLLGTIFIFSLFFFFFLVLLVIDSEYSRSEGSKPTLSLSCIYLASPGALRAGGTQSVAVRPRSAGSSDQLRASRAFPLQKKEKKKKKKKRQRKKE
jgi:hypothetical protein